jgi:hypothetical protein
MLMRFSRKRQQENSSILKQSPRPLEELVEVPNVTAITESKRTLEALNR